jgi:hypothetical protein
MEKKISILLITLLLCLALPAVVAAEDGQPGRFVFGGDFVLGPGQVLDGDLVVMGGRARTEAESLVDGSIVIMGGSVSVAGTVNEDIAVMGGSAYLERTARVRGQVISIGGQVTRVPGAEIQGDTVESFPVLPFRWTPSFWIPAGFDVLGNIFGAIMTTLALVALAVLVILLLPEQTEQVAAIIVDEPWLSVGAGLLTMILMPVLLLLLLITCIGPFLLGLAFGIAVLFGWIALGLVIGRRLVEAMNTKNTTALVETLVGVILITLLSRVPCIGWLLSLIGAAFGLGAVLLTRFGTTTYPWPEREPLPEDTSRLPTPLDAEAVTEGETTPAEPTPTMEPEEEEEFGPDTDESDRIQ